ncbi:hypothetical protein GCK32_000360 [Trichostrongylus colubriformis]|uniref:SET domain-containing protein n=1 Tax=Trichostrongylus colubriformis TaxID=6319 RepID=A0AAN8FXW1_TRICO
MYKVLLLLVLLCTERGNADFGTYVPDVVHLPAQLDADFHAELLRNGLHAEIVGEVADQKKECGILLMDYTAYVDGELFEVAVKAIENDLLTSISSAFLNETLQYTLYKAMKATALAAHKAEMRQLFDIRRASTPIYRSVDLRLFPFAGLVVLGIGMGIGGLMVKGITSLMQNQEVKALEKEMTDEWLFLIQTFNMISNTLTFEASSLRFGYALTLVRQQLLSRVRDTLDQLFAFGRIAEELMETSSNHSFMLATQQLMGERFKNSLLALHGSSARNALKATVTGMNKKVMEIQLCYPTTMPSDVNYLLRVEPLGQFSHNMSFFWMHDIGGLYAVAKNQTNVTLADLKTVQDENACYLSSSVQLCKLREQAPGCTLLMADRHSCRFVVRNSSNTHNDGSRLRSQLPTRAAPLISRERLCITANIADDPHYRGGLTPHSVFLETPDKTLMFAHQHDDCDEVEKRHYVQTYSASLRSKRSLSWMSRVDSELKLWRKLIREQHPILQSYFDALKRTTSVPVRMNNDLQVHQEVRQICRPYASNVERFMLVALRSRKRYGETVTLDDAIYSFAIIEEFFHRMQEAHVPVSVRSLFAKAILSFYKFIDMNMGPGAGPDRCSAMRYALKYAEDKVKKTNEEKRVLETYSGADGNKEPEMERYCVVRAIMESKRIGDGIKMVMQNFSTCGSLQWQDYSYVMRRGAARMELERAVEKEMRALYNFADPDIARTQSHQQSAQELYVKTYQSSCVYGYVKLRLFAKEEASKSNEIKARIKQVKKLLKQSASGSGPSPVAEVVPSTSRQEDVIQGSSEDRGSHNTLELQSGTSSEESLYNDVIGDYETDSEPTTSGTAPSGGPRALRSASLPARKREKKQRRLSVEDHGASAETFEDDSDNVREELESSRSDRRRKNAREATHTSYGGHHQKETESVQAFSTTGIAEAAEVQAEFGGDAATQPKHSIIRPKTKRGQQVRTMMTVKAKAAPTVAVEEVESSTAAERTTITSEPTTSEAMEQEQEPEHQRAVFRRGARSAARLQREQEQTLRDRYAAQIPEIADPARVLSYMQDLNSRQYSGGLGYFQSEYEQQCFNLRRVAQPIQDFPWLEIRDVPSIGGKGLFAKVAIQKDQVVSDYRGLFVASEDRLKMRMDSVNEKLVGDYEVEYNGYFVSEQGVRTQRKYSILAHDPIYKGAVTLGRLFNHSSRHANLYTQTPQHRYATDQGQQMQFLVLFRAKRNIDPGEQLLWDYGKHYKDTTATPMTCLCNECKPQLESFTDLRIPVEVRPRLEVVPVDDDSYSQQMGILDRIAIRNKINVRAVITSRNVFLSLNAKTRVAGLVPRSNANAFAHPFDAYRFSRHMFLGREDDYPALRDRHNIPPANANALLQLLCVAYKDAYEMGNPVVLVLTRKGQRKWFMRKKKADTTFVVLLGPIIGSVERKRYGNCIIYEDMESRCQVVSEQTEDSATEKSLLEMYGEARLMYFPIAVEAMWTKLHGNNTIDVNQVLELMEEFDPNAYLRKRLQQLTPRDVRV